MVGLKAEGPARDRVLKLMEEKDRIESEIRDQTAVLEKNNVGMFTSLVDERGFPRSDIDVYNIRHARAKIICLQNDHKNVMKQIEQGLAEVHSDFLGTPYNANQAGTSSSNDVLSNGYQANKVIDYGRESIAFVSFVDEGSPADLGGLCVDDLILQFGSLNYTNFRDMKQIFDVVAHSIGQKVNVIVRRNRNIVQLSIVPQRWERPGLLGCHIQSNLN